MVVRVRVVVRGGPVFNTRAVKYLFVTMTNKQLRVGFQCNSSMFAYKCNYNSTLKCAHRLEFIDVDL